MNRVAPQPRKGLLGSWDRIVGPGASRTETVAMLLAMAVSVLLAWFAANLFRPVAWPWWTWSVVLVLASDLGGGLVANALPATKRWYHRPSASAMGHLSFAAMHVHVFAFAWLVPKEMPWQAAIGLYVWMMIGCVLVLIVPAAIQRALAFALTALGTIGFAAIVPTASPLGWTAIVLLLKILAGHMIGPDREYS